MSHDVFISYSSRDKPTADALCHTLEAAGVRCWMAPRDIQPGEDWGTAIIRAISSARVFVLVFSANANGSVQIRREVERAVDRGIPIIPFRIEDVKPVDALEYFISTPHWLDAYTPPLEKHLEYLTQTVQALLSGAPQPTRAAEPPRKRIGRAQWAYMSALGALALLIVLLNFRPPSHAGHWTSTKIADARDALAPRFSSLPLQAVMVSAVTGPKAHVDLQNSDTGFYRLEYAGEDDGAVRRNGDGLVFTSSLTGASDTMTYTALSRDSMPSTMGARPGDSVFMLESPGKWQIMWAGTPAPTAGNLLPAAIVGDWRNTFIMTSYMGQMWAGELSIAPDGAYRLRVTRKESGQYDAAKGRWKRTPSFLGAAGPLTEQGSYRFHGANSVTYVSDAGAITLRRVGGYQEAVTGSSPTAAAAP